LENIVHERFSTLLLGRPAVSIIIFSVNKLFYSR